MYNESAVGMMGIIVVFNKLGVSATSWKYFCDF